MPGTRKLGRATAHRTAMLRGLEIGRASCRERV